MADHGTFHWNELVTDNVERAKKFYGAVVGWESEEMPMPDGKYTIVKSKGKPVGGIMNKSDIPMLKNAPSHWGAYIQVDNVDAAVGKVAGAGGKVVRPCFDVPGVGRIAIIQDPTGGVVGIMTPAAQSA